MKPSTFAARVNLLAVESRELVEEALSDHEELNGPLLAQVSYLSAAADLLAKVADDCKVGRKAEKPPVRGGA